MRIVQRIVWMVSLLVIGACNSDTTPGGAGEPCNPASIGVPTPEGSSTDGCDAVTQCVNGTCQPASNPGGSCSASTQQNCNNLTGECSANPNAQAPCYCAAACDCACAGDSGCEQANRASAAQLGTTCSY